MQYGFVRFITMCVVVALGVVAVAAGCGANSKKQTLSAGDLRRITILRPVTPGWGWPQKTIPPDAPPPGEPPHAKTTTPATPDPLVEALDKQIAAAGGVVAEDGWRWQDEKKLGVTHAWLLERAVGAHAALAAERAFQGGFVKRTVDVYGGIFTDVPVEGLGDEAWRIQSDFPGGQEVTYGWRRASLVLQVHIQCIFQTCPSDIRRAGRAWVDAIDKEAADTINRETRTSR